MKEYKDIIVKNRYGSIIASYRMIDGPLEITDGWIIFKKKDKSYMIAMVSSEAGKIIIE